MKIRRMIISVVLAVAMFAPLGTAVAVSAESDTSAVTTEQTDKDKKQDTSTGSENVTGGVVSLSR